ncbi:hypothetical protein UC98_01275 [Campylobacter jejuni]|uniref:DUF5675 family protein n=1 Tax=Campylobacter jejuni TaxID=197 RepID=UPI000707C30E|nr:DUF5675 family protein [Campylobacter jejuni]EAJ1021104.1 hypothetical protein [Campylobacter jejuni]KQH37750.1 hypothetical protein UC99_07125 [Campylobacter jejuni]KQH40567.1 hypothetical protein UC98_01275 [Campylobacter jejuni]UKV97635.1 DUF5675 family protein [Campylobacter jejuni subsp. jejuni]HEB9539935.1 hypothetical protein [Campylobacter jejuni]
MKVTINRRYTGKTCVIGKFKVLDDEEILFECFSLERKEEGLESGKNLRVPAGVYDLKRHINSSFNDKGKKEVAGVIVLKEDDSVLNIYNNDVDFERHILIHWGNTYKDTKGCILLGLTKDNNNESVGQSRLACKKFYDLMYGKNLEDIKLEITNELA